MWFSMQDTAGCCESLKSINETRVAITGAREYYLAFRKSINIPIVWITKEIPNGFSCSRTTSQVNKHLIYMFYKKLIAKPAC